MSTSVVLLVTPRYAVDPDQYDGRVPDDVAEAFDAAGQQPRAGLEQRGRDPVRWTFQLSGRDRLAAGQQLVDRLRALGYPAELVVGR